MDWIKGGKETLTCEMCLLCFENILFLHTERWFVLGLSEGSVRPTKIPSSPFTLKQIKTFTVWSISLNVLYHVPLLLSFPISLFLPPRKKKILWSLVSVDNILTDELLTHHIVISDLDFLYRSNYGRRCLITLLLCILFVSM